MTDVIRFPDDFLWGATTSAYQIEGSPLADGAGLEVPDHQERIRAMRGRLFDPVQATGGMQIPLRRGDWQAAERKGERP